MREHGLAEHASTHTFQPVGADSVRWGMLAHSVQPGMLGDVSAGRAGEKNAPEHASAHATR